MLKDIMDENMPRFANHSHYQQTDNGLELKTFVGKEALGKQLEDCREAAKENANIDLETLKPLTMFDWLLTQEENIEVLKYFEKS